MYQVSSRIEKLAFVRDACGFHVVDFKEARKMLRNLKVSKAGQKLGTFTDGVRTWVASIPVFNSKRYKPKPQVSAGESGRMTPSRPTSGSVWSGTYARRLNGLAAGHGEAIELFYAWNGSHKKIGNSGDGTPEITVFKLSPNIVEPTAMKERAILFFPSAGQLTKYLRGGRRSRYVDSFR